MKNNQIHVRIEGKFPEYRDIALEDINVTPSMTVGQFLAEFEELKKEVAIANEKIVNLTNVVISLAKNIGSLAVESRSKISNLEEEIK